MSRTREIILGLIALSPFAYLGMIWNELPEQVPIHFNIRGEADNWAGKGMMFFIPAALGFFINGLMLLIPKIDPKKRIESMGNKYHSFRTILTVFFTAIALYMIYVTEKGKMDSPNILIGIIGGLFAAMGNYFQTVRPNYFFGLRTPWTLENDEVWRKTHKLAGRIWMAGGILIAVLAFIFSDNLIFSLVFGIVIAILVLIPLVYSYVEFRRQKQNEQTKIQTPE